MEFQELADNILPWLITSGLKILMIIVLAIVAKMVLGRLMERTIRRLVVAGKYGSAEAEKKREDTIIRIFSSTLKLAIWIIALLMVLQELGVAIGPLLAAAGIAGLAFGFGGQYLIRDLISGLFIIMENQYRVGDVVCFDKTCGLVEDISLRMTTLRDLDGTVHHVPHGEIAKVSNLTKSYSRVNLNIGVAYDTDLEKAIEVVNQVGQELASDPVWQEHIIKPPQFLRVDDFADSAIVLKILGETKPIKQWDVAGELRRRLKIAFDREGIEIPFPQRVVHTVRNHKKQK